MSAGDLFTAINSNRIGLDGCLLQSFHMICYLKQRLQVLDKYESTYSDVYMRGIYFSCFGV